MTCSVCGKSAYIMAVRLGDVLCFSCLAERFTPDAKLVASYLVRLKDVKPDAGYPIEVKAV